ncbi:MAG: hypothetical protein AABX70_07835 [Nanoarchaeota archaeon]
MELPLFVVELELLEEGPLEVPELIDPQGVLAWEIPEEDQETPAITKEELNKTNKTNKPILFIALVNNYTYLSFTLSL